MRVIGNIPHPELHISLFSWNGKYIVKFEKGNLEQTFKLPEYEFQNEAGLTAALHDTFLKEILENFRKMEKDLSMLLQ